MSSAELLPRDAELLLVVDQFEELFTLTVDEHERAPVPRHSQSTGDRSRVPARGCWSRCVPTSTTGPSDTQGLATCCGGAWCRLRFRRWRASSRSLSDLRRLSG